MPFTVQFVTPRNVTQATTWIQIPESLGFTGSPGGRGGASILGAVCVGQTGIGFDECVFFSAGINNIVITDVIPLDKAHENNKGSNAVVLLPANVKDANDFLQNTIATYTIANSFDGTFPPMASGHVAGLCADGEGNVVTGFESPARCFVTKTVIDGAVIFASCIVVTSSLLGAEAIPRCAAGWTGCQLAQIIPPPPPPPPIPIPIIPPPIPPGTPPPPGIRGHGFECEILFYKHPNDVLDYSINWSSWLAPGDSLTASTWAADAGLTIVTSSVSGNVTKVTLSGGTDGQLYSLRNAVGTVAGRIELRTAIVVVLVCHTAPPDPPPALGSRFMLERVFIKNPSTSTDIQINWGDYLAAINDTIALSTWSAPAGVTISGSTYSATTTVVRVAGGVTATNYNLTNTITTQTGRVEVRHVLVEVQACAPNTSTPI